jgi:hypothetical protein
MLCRGRWSKRWGERVNKGGFSWRRFIGVSAAKARISRATGIPLTRSGRHQKIGRIVTRGGCLLPGVSVLLTLLAAALAVAT